MLPDKVIYVYSGKGGVGKSTLSVNLAYAMSLEGYKVGLFDADLSGSSVPIMIGKLEEKKPSFDNFKIIPGEYGGIYCNSLGFITEPVEGGYWHGKYLEGVLNQLLFETDWNDSEVLVIDLPPGINEVHRNLFSRLNGKCIIVTTPQDLSYIDTIRGMEMLNRFKIDMIGVVENMSHYVCECGQVDKVFKGDTKKNLCEPFNLELLLKIPLNSKISQYSNRGIPFFINDICDESSSFRELSKLVVINYDSYKTVRPTN